MGDGPDITTSAEGGTSFLKRNTDRVINILVAEDDPVLRVAIVRDISKLGHTVYVSKDGEEALELFRSHQVHAVVTDWAMPKKDGLELAKAIRGMKTLSYTYIIMVSANNMDRHSMEMAMDAGIDDFLPKPFDRADLFLRLRVASRIVSFHSEIKELRQLLPICMYCRKIRDDGNYWRDIESYVSDHSSTDFSHGVCPECAETIVRPQIAKSASGEH